MGTGQQDGAQPQRDHYRERCEVAEQDTERLDYLDDWFSNGKPILLAVAGAFHTPLMESACARLAEALSSVSIQTPRIPVVSNVDAKVHTEPEDIRQVLIRQVTQPVLWEDSIRWLLSQGAGPFFEIGPGKVLKGLMKRINRKVDCESVNDTP